MNEGDTAEKNASTTPAEPLRKKEEFRTWFFLTFVMAPVLAVLTVSGFGFVVWIYQLFTGPPGS
jgi:nitrate reductase NapE